MGTAQAHGHSRSKTNMTQPQTVSREPTMEEILASIRRIIEDGNTDKDLEAADAEPAAADIAEFSREFAEADVFAKPAKDAVVQNQNAQAHAAALQTMEAKPEPSRFPTYEDMVADRNTAIAAPESAAIVNVPSPVSELRPIISEAASRHVAKSFEHLSVALHEERNTSVAQMTEDMVRPMLQDWLDNNLPTLVERLVREEIERVSRGAR
jgi:uncharacterized protein